MLQSPRKKKYKKSQKRRIKGKNFMEVDFGVYGLKTLENNRVTAAQIEAARKIISKKLKKIGTFWIRIFPDTPITSKPAEVRMGKGKGNLDFWSARVRAGTIIFEVSDVSQQLAEGIFKESTRKLPFKTKMIKRKNIYSLVD